MQIKSPKMRQEAIKKLLNKERISDQKQLVQLLQEQHGIETNQAVVSRDLRHLGVIKKSFNDQLIYELPTSNVNIEMLKLAIITIEYNETTIVIKTHSGMASFVGDCLDQCLELEILGCIAGENVVFITPRSIKNIHVTYEAICQNMHFKGNAEARNLKLRNNNE